jgi:hypothetical protein
MNTLERTIYIGLIALMVGVVSLNYLTTPTQSELWTDMVEKKQTADEKQQPAQTEIQERDPLSLFTLEVNNGYKIYYDAKDEPLVISKTIGENNFVEIEIKSTGMSYGDYMNGVYMANGNKIPDLYDGPNGWKYYKDELWISTPSPKITQEGGNISKVFLKEICDNVFTITQNDYTGGKYDKEIEKLISKISLRGRHW